MILLNKGLEHGLGLFASIFKLQYLAIDQLQRSQLPSCNQISGNYLLLYSPQVHLSHITPYLLHCQTHQYCRCPLPIMPFRQIKSHYQRKKGEAYQGSLNVSFHQPCLEQFATILSKRTIISEKVGLTTDSGSQHSSINSFKSGG